ncbi:MAG: hypothetical protein RIS92_3173 [Verrucomicrobiota bacterium]
MALGDSAAGGGWARAEVGVGAHLRRHEGFAFHKRLGKAGWGGGTLRVQPLDKFLDWGDAGFDEVLRAALSIEDGGLAEVDAHVVVKGGEDLLKLHGPFGYFAADAIGCSDDLSGAHSATGEQRERGFWPVVAAVHVVDFWGATELAPNDHGNVFVHSAFMKVGEQCGDAEVEVWELCTRLDEVHAIAAVPVPTAVVEGDDARSGFDEAPGEEEVADHAGCTVTSEFGIIRAVAFEHTGVFVGDVEGACDAAAGEEVDGLLMERVESFHDAGVVCLAFEGIECGAEGDAVAQTFEGDSVEGHVLRFGVRVFGDESHGRVGGADEPAGAGFAPAPFAGGVHE